MRVVFSFLMFKLIFGLLLLPDDSPTSSTDENLNHANHFGELCLIETLLLPFYHFILPFYHFAVNKDDSPAETTANRQMT